MSDATYIGSELELFANAVVWKDYLRRRIAPFLGDEVLEVGAGLGGTTRLLCRGEHKRWVCLEPDPALARQIEQAIREGSLPSCCSEMVGTLEQIEAQPTFDTLLYIDVLEHIEDDRAELARAAGMLKPGGHVVALSPAHNWLFTPFDKVIGHYRRYTRPTMRGAHAADTRAGPDRVSRLRRTIGLAGEPPHASPVDAHTRPDRGLGQGHGPRFEGARPSPGAQSRQVGPGCLAKASRGMNADFRRWPGRRRSITRGIPARPGAAR